MSSGFEQKPQQSARKKESALQKIWLKRTGLPDRRCGQESDRQGGGIQRSIWLQQRQVHHRGCSTFSAEPEYKQWKVLVMGLKFHSSILYLLSHILKCSVFQLKTDITISSFNTRGLKDSIKRKAAFLRTEGKLFISSRNSLWYFRY